MRARAPSLLAPRLLENTELSPACSGEAKGGALLGRFTLQALSFPIPARAWRSLSQGGLWPPAWIPRDCQVKPYPLTEGDSDRYLHIP